MSIICNEYKNEKHSYNISSKTDSAASFVWHLTCHPEIYGIGLEYTWGYAKLRYHIEFSNAIYKKIEDNMKQSLFQTKTTNKWVHIFAKKEREYKVTYMFLLKYFWGAAENNGHILSAPLNSLRRIRMCLMPTTDLLQ